MFGTAVLGLIAIAYVFLAYISRKQGSNAVCGVCVVIAVACAAIAFGWSFV